MLEAGKSTDGSESYLCQTDPQDLKLNRNKDTEVLKKQQRKEVDQHSTSYVLDQCVCRYLAKKRARLQNLLANPHCTPDWGLKSIHTV